MKITHLYTGKDNKSHFEDINYENSIVKELGAYTEKLPASGIMFRESYPGNLFEMHNAPQPQYIIYLEGEVEVTTSSGETRVFKAGDVLFANDTTGEGHISKALTAGRSAVITTLL